VHKRRVPSRLGKLTALTGAAVLLAATSATAHVDGFVDDGAIDNAKATHGHDVQQHGGDEGHLPPVQEGGLVVKSKTRLSNVVEGKIADVGVLGTTAYLAAWGGQTCDKNGVHVVDIADVANPVEIGFIKSKEGSYPGEGVQALPISTPAFNGNILVTNNEQCKPGVGFGGINIYDVTDPAHPNPLSVGFGDDQQGPGQGKKAAHETHSVFAWDAGAKAYAVMVDNAETADIDIVDITNPKKPVLIAEYDLAVLFPQILQPGKGLDEVFLHDMVVKEIGGRQVMLASYWDGGYVQLDVTNPKAATLIADSDFSDEDPQGQEGTAPSANYEDGVQGKPLTVNDGVVPPEGNAHQAEFAGAGNEFVIGADEDFSPYALTSTAGDEEIDAAQGSDTPALEPGQTVSGQAVYFGVGCRGTTPGVTAPEGAAGQIAVVERGVCSFTEKVAAVEAAGGYEGVLIINRTGADGGCNDGLSMSVEGTIPAFGVTPREEGFGIFNLPGYVDAACKAGDGTQVLPIAIGTTGDSLSFTSYFDGWGYMRLFKSSPDAGGKMTELDTYAVPEAHDPARAQDSGDLSVHEVATSAKNSNIGYVSYYAAGLRMIEVVDNKIVEKAAFIDEGGNNFWGVQVFTGSDGKEYVAASDRDLGLYIFEYVPVNTP